eukprot:scaffold236024_cov24-Tisochrysis_lutea.AAC.2
MLCSCGNNTGMLAADPSTSASHTWHSLCSAKRHDAARVCDGGHTCTPSKAGTCMLVSAAAAAAEQWENGEPSMKWQMPYCTQ